MLSPTFPEVDLPHLADVPLPPMLRLRLDPSVARGRSPTSASAVDEALARSRRFDDLRTGCERRGRGRQPRHRPHPEGRGGRGTASASSAASSRSSCRRWAATAAPPPKGRRACSRISGSPRRRSARRCARPWRRSSTAPPLHGIPCRFDKNAGRRGRGPVHQPGQVAHELRPADRERAHQADRGRPRQAGGRPERPSPGPARLHRGAAGARPDRDRAFADRLRHRAGRERRQAAER